MGFSLLRQKPRRTRMVELLIVNPWEMNLIEAYIRIANSDIPYDQLILEYGRWVHMAIAREGAEPRRELLMIFEQGHYLPFDENDPRVVALA